jgi:prepilin-type N-terminal cleavage/methylation domain-containing protein
MRTVRTAAFTLVELLVVIAIIGILFGFTAVAVPRVLERAKIAQTTSTATQLRTVLSTYYTDYGSYPPRYGYVRDWERDQFGQPTGNVRYYMRPYLHQLGIYSIEGYEDPFSTGHDTAGPFGRPSNNPDGSTFPIGILEFFPVGFTDPAFPGQRQYPSDNELYRGINSGGPAAQDAERQMGEDRRAFIYIPVNTRQFERVKAYYERDGLNEDRAYARVFDYSDPRLEPFANPIASFPAPNYDAFVLLSVGPGGETGGILVDPLGTEPDGALYHVTAMRAYYLATRDINTNGVKDFDFLARSRQNEATAVQNEVGPQYSLLPDGSNRYGPLIFAY